MALVKEWFSTHVATQGSRGTTARDTEIIHIDWRNPGTGSYAISFIICDNVVIVTGDCGDAIYGFTQPPTLQKLATFDWHYFTHKCVASETGRNYTQKIQGIKQPVTNIRAIAHFVGLQMAIKQLGL